MIGGLLVDRIGFGPGGRRSAHPARLIGAAMAIGAVCLTQIGQTAGEIAYGLIVLAMGVSGLMAVQMALNGRVNQTAGDPVTATTVHMVVATLTVGAVTAGVAITHGIDVVAWPSKPWLYAGGICGITLIAFIAMSARVLDVLRLALTINGGQLLGALAIDSFVPGGRGVTIWVAVGAVLTWAAVAVASRPPRAAPPVRPIGSGRRHVVAG